MPATLDGIIIVSSYNGVTREDTKTSLRTTASFCNYLKKKGVVIELIAIESDSEEWEISYKEFLSLCKKSQWHSSEFILKLFDHFGVEYDLPGV